MIIIRLPSIALRWKHVFVAHDGGDWGPESHNDCPSGDFRKHRMLYGRDEFVLRECDFFEVGEEFKLIVPVENEVEAQEIITTRTKAGVFENFRTDGAQYDFDESTNCLWFLAPGFPIKNKGEWNQNSVYQ